MTFQVQGHPWSMIACQDARDWCTYCWQLQQRLSYTSLLWLPLIVGEFVVQSKHYNDSINMAICATSLSQACTCLNARATNAYFSWLSHDCCACIRYRRHRSTTKLHVLELVSVADTVVHRSVIANIKPIYTTVTTHAALGFMLLAVAYCSRLLWFLVNHGQCVVRRGIGLCIVKPYTGKLTGDTQRKRQTMQQAAVCTILQCDAGISHHHTAATAAALTRSSQCCCCCCCCGCASFSIDPIHCRVRGHTGRQRDRHTLFGKICSVLKSCISDSSMIHNHGTTTFNFY